MQPLTSAPTARLGDPRPPEPREPRESISSQELAGRLEERSPIRLVQRLHKARLSARLSLPSGEIWLDEGRVVAARLDRGGRSHGGVKAFQRLARERTGNYQILSSLGSEPPAPSGASMEIPTAIEVDVVALLVGALEDTATPYPAPETRLRLERRAALQIADGPSHRSKLLTVLRRFGTVGEVMEECELPDLTILKALAALRREGVLELLPPPAPVAVITDSGADLPAQLVRRLDLTVVPQGLCTGDRMLVDDGEHSAEDFFHWARRHGVEAWSRPMSAGALGRCYREARRRRPAVALHSPEGLSTILKQARELAGRALPSDSSAPRSLEVVEAGQFGPGLGLLTLLAGRMAHRGDPPQVIARRLERFSRRVVTLFGVEQPVFVQCFSSRSSGASGAPVAQREATAKKAWGDSRPILALDEGKLQILDREDGGLPERLLHFLGERLDPQRPVMLMVSQAKASAAAAALLQGLQNRFQIWELLEAEIRPTVALHTGPGSLAVAAFQPSDIEWQVIRPVAELESV